MSAGLRGVLAMLMRDWVTGLSIALALAVATWGILFVLARRLPPGILRDLAASLDDVIVVASALRYAARRVPRDVLLAAWPGEPRLMLRLLGPASILSAGAGACPKEQIL